MAETLFTKILNKQIPATFIYEDELCFAINDVNPQAPVHVLVIPKRPLDRLSSAQTEDQMLLGHLLLVVGKITRLLKIEGAFRLVVNNGADAGQSVFHLHLHILAGRVFHWPPG